MKFDLFDSEELEVDEWYPARCVLDGERGATEEAITWTKVSESGYRTDALAVVEGDMEGAVFSPFVAKRQPRTSALAKVART